MKGGAAFPAPSQVASYSHKVNHACPKRNISELLVSLIERRILGDAVSSQLQRLSFIDLPSVGETAI